MMELIPLKGLELMNSCPKCGVEENTEKEKLRFQTYLKRGVIWAIYEYAVLLNEAYLMAVQNEPEATPSESQVNLYTRVVEAFSKCASLGHLEAMYTLSNIYAKDYPGVPQDYIKSISYLKAAAEKNHGKSNFILSSKYDTSSPSDDPPEVTEKN